MPPCRTHRATYEKFADCTAKDISDELPFDLPQGWAWARIKNLGTFVGGHTPSIADTTNWENGTVLWVTSKDMKQKYIDTTGIKLSRKGAAELHLLPTGSLIMVTRSGILRRTFPIALAAKPLTINQDQRALEFYDNAIGEYIYYCVKSLEPIILRDYRKTGTTVESIVWERFVEMPLPIPPIEEQKRIVSMVGELFGYAKKINEATDGIEKTTARIDKKILDLAIRGQLVPQDPNDEPASELVKRIEAAKRVNAGGRVSTRAASDRPAYEIDPPFDIPNSWEWVRLGVIAQCLSGTTPNKALFAPEGIPYFKVAEMNLPGNERFLTHTSFYIAQGTFFKTFCKGTIVFPKNGGAMLTNKKRILSQESVCDLNTGGLSPYISEVADYLYEWFCTVDLCKYVKGGVIPTTDADKLRSTPVPLPPLAEQKRIVTKIKELRAMTKSLTT